MYPIESIDQPRQSYAALVRTRDHERLARQVAPAGRGSSLITVIRERLSVRRPVPVSRLAES